MLSDWINAADSPCVFVTGMGGIGKSTLVRAFLAEHNGVLRNVLYLSFNNSIKEPSPMTMQHTSTQFRSLKKKVWMSIIKENCVHSMKSLREHNLCS